MTMRNTQLIIDDAVDKFRKQLVDTEAEKNKSDYLQYMDRLKKRTCSIKELGEILGVSKEKARQLVHIDGFPVFKMGREYRVILSGLDKWLEENIGLEIE